MLTKAPYYPVEKYEKTKEIRKEKEVLRLKIDLGLCSFPMGSHGSQANGRVAGIGLQRGGGGDHQILRAS